MTNSDRLKAKSANRKRSPEKLRTLLAASYKLAEFVKVCGLVLRVHTVLSDVSSLSLQGFILQNDPAFKWERGQATFLQRLLQSPPDRPPEIPGQTQNNTAILLPDEKMKFSEVLFRGIEYDLIILDLLVRTTPCLGWCYSQTRFNTALLNRHLVCLNCGSFSQWYPQYLPIWYTAGSKPLRASMARRILHGRV